MRPASNATNFKAMTGVEGRMLTCQPGWKVEAGSDGVSVTEAEATLASVVGGVSESARNMQGGF